MFYCFRQLNVAETGSTNCHKDQIKCKMVDEGTISHQPLSSSHPWHPRSNHNDVHGHNNHSIGSSSSLPHSIGSKKAGLVLLLIFITSLIALIIIYRNFPKLDQNEREKIRVPKNLNDAKELASVLSRYREKYYGSVFCGILLAYVL